MIRDTLGKNKVSKNKHGFGLVELLVAMALSSLLLMGVVQIYVNSKQTFNRQEGVSRIQENARFAMDRIVKAISASGYLGCLSPGSAIFENVLGDQSGGNDFANPVWGQESVGAIGTDSLVVKRALPGGSIEVVGEMDSSSDPLLLDAGSPNYGGLQQWDVVTVSNCGQASTFMITNDPSSSGGIIAHQAVTDTNTGQSNVTGSLRAMYGSQNDSLAVVMPIRSDTYTIGNSAAGVCSAGNLGFCALHENGAELVEGVSNLIVEYGEDTGADGVADIYRRANSVADWASVVSVRITLDINDIERVTGSGDGIVSLPPQTYTQTIRLRNRGA